MMRTLLVHSKGGRCARVVLAILLLGSWAWLGCEVDRVKFNRLEEGQRFLRAGDPFQAVVYFQESLEREPETRSKALAWLVVALDRAAKKVATIPAKRQQYEAERDQRIEAIRNDPRAIAFLVDILDEHSVNSQSAAELLVRIGADAADALIAAYKTKPVDRELILDIFRQIGPPILPKLQEAVRTNQQLSNREKMLLVRLIGEVGGQDSVAFLRELRNDSEVPPGLRVEAAAQLYRLGDKQQRDYLVASLNSERPLVREAASNAMQYLNESPQAGLLLKHLDDPNAQVRENIARALGVHRAEGQKAVRRLIQVIRTDENNDVASAAQKALGEYGPQVIDPVMEALKHEREWTRRQRLVQVLNNDKVRTGFSQDQEYELYQYYEKGEQNEIVRNDIGRLLTQMEEDRSQQAER